MWNSNIGLINDHSFVTQVNQNLGLVQGYPKAVLTPNAMEFSRLAKSVLHREVLVMSFAMVIVMELIDILWRCG